MGTYRFTITNDELNAEINAASTFPDTGIQGSQVYTQLIANLIEEAPVDFWEKHPEEIEPDDFFAQVLASLARSYAASLPETTQMQAFDFLKQLIEGLQRTKYLQEWLPQDDDEDE